MSTQMKVSDVQCVNTAHIHMYILRDLPNIHTSKPLLCSQFSQRVHYVQYRQEATLSFVYIFYENIQVVGLSNTFKTDTVHFVQ